MPSPSHEPFSIVVAVYYTPLSDQALLAVTHGCFKGKGLMLLASLVAINDQTWTGDHGRPRVGVMVRRWGMEMILDALVIDAAMLISRKAQMESITRIL